MIIQCLTPFSKYGSTTNTWNYRDRLTATNDGKGSSATTTTYRYDENDQRVAQDVRKGAGATTTTTYFSNLYERTGSATTTLYIYAAGQLIATIEGNGAATSTYVTHTDHLGSSNVQSDKYGKLAQLTNYYPYGGMIQNVQPANGYNTKKKFLNQTYDDAIAQSYLNARFLQNNNGRFTSLDPVSRDIGGIEKMPAYILMMGQGGGMIDQNTLLADPQLQNSYSYAKNNPVTLSDPSGQNPYLMAGGAAFVASVTWNLGRDFVQNYKDVRAGALPAYMITQGRGENPGGRYMKDASASAALAIGTVGAGVGIGKALGTALTVGGVQTVTALAGGALNAGVGVAMGDSYNRTTGQLNGVALTTDFLAGFVGTRIGQQIGNPVGAPPSTIGGSLASMRAVLEQMRVQLGQGTQVAGNAVAGTAVPKQDKTQ